MTDTNKAYQDFDKFIKRFRYKYGDVENTNISKINNLIGSGKNVSIEAKLIDNKRFDIDDIVINLLTFDDNTGVINTLIITSKSDYTKFKGNNYYRVSGNIKVYKKDTINDFSELLSKLNINNFIKNNIKLLCVRSIQRIDNKVLIDSVRLSLYHNNCNDLIKLDLPISSIDIMEINKINKSILYLKNGNYDETISCNELDMRIDINKINKKYVSILLSDICIFSIGLIFNNGESKYYNLPYYSSNGLINNLQRINKINNKISISIDEEYEYEFVKW